MVYSYHDKRAQVNAHLSHHGREGHESQLHGEDLTRLPEAETLGAKFRGHS